MSDLIKRIKEEIQQALKQFGEYSYYDKGADEIMEISPWVEELKELGGKKAGEILAKLADEENVGPFITSVLYRLQEWEDSEWDDMMESGGEKVDALY